MSFRLPLELREEDDVADAFGTGEHHDDAVDTDADGRWHALFEGEDEIFTDLLHLITSLIEQALEDWRSSEHPGGDFLAVNQEHIDIRAHPHSLSQLHAQPTNAKAVSGYHYHAQNPILRRRLPFSPECSAFAFFTFAISRSSISCVTIHRFGFVSTLPA